MYIGSRGGNYTRNPEHTTLGIAIYMATGYSKRTSVSHKSKRYIDYKRYLTSRNSYGVDGAGICGGGSEVWTHWKLLWKYIRSLINIQRKYPNINPRSYTTSIPCTPETGKKRIIAHPNEHIGGKQCNIRHTITGIQGWNNSIGTKKSNILLQHKFPSPP